MPSSLSDVRAPKSARRLRLIFTTLTAIAVGLLVQQGSRAADVTTSLGTVTVSADTGEKPQSKIWFHNGTWWSVLPSTSVSPTGTWVWRLESNNTWTNILQVSSSTTAHADVKRV